MADRNGYSSEFDDAEINDGAHYGPNQVPGEEGTSCPPTSPFNDPISFNVDWEDQAEVDYYRHELSADGGEEGQCGWLTDRYGVSWQVVPAVLPELLRDEDAEKASRVTEAMLQMQKLDVEALEAAYVE